MRTCVHGTQQASKQASTRNQSKQKQRQQQADTAITQQQQLLAGGRVRRCRADFELLQVPEVCRSMWTCVPFIEIVYTFDKPDMFVITLWPDPFLHPPAADRPHLQAPSPLAQALGPTEGRRLQRYGFTTTSCCLLLHADNNIYTVSCVCCRAGQMGPAALRYQPLLACLRNEVSPRT